MYLEGQLDYPELKHQQRLECVQNISDLCRTSSELFLSTCAGRSRVLSQSRIITKRLQQQHRLTVSYQKIGICKERLTCLLFDILERFYNAFQLPAQFCFQVALFDQCRQVLTECLGCPDVWALLFDFLLQLLGRFQLLVHSIRQCAGGEAAAESVIQLTQGTRKASQEALILRAFDDSLVNPVTPVPQLSRQVVPLLGHSCQLFIHDPM